MTQSLGGVTRRFPIRFDDIDAGGIVYHARFVSLLDEAIFDWWQEAGWNFNGPEAAVVRAVNIEYLAPIRALGFVDIQFAITRIGKTSATYSFEFRTGDTVNARGDRTMVFIDLASGVPTAVPEELTTMAAELIALR